jgi:hypothetical protein
MKRLIRLTVLALLLMLPIVIWAETPSLIIESPVSKASAMPSDMETALTTAAATVCNPPDGCSVTDFERTVVIPGIVHYSAIIQVGPGSYDKIGLHRVVLENRPGFPIKSRDRIFLQHGDGKNFVGMFLPTLYSPTTPEDFGIAIYLAQSRVDVWGIDQGWTMVPADTPDFTFMADWGLQRQVDDLSSAIAIAREVRRLMRGSDDRFNLLGYSSGGMTGYALLNEETQKPKRARNVQGFVPADIPFKTNSPELRAVFCSEVDRLGLNYELGIFEEFIPFALIGVLARSDPDGESPILPPLTNLQTAFFFGVGPIFGETPIHYLAGEFDEYPFAPTGLQYMTTEAWLDFLESAPPYEPTLFLLDYSEVLCDIADSPFDDFLMDVSVPVLNWGAAGGLGPYGWDTMVLLGSRDVSEHIVSLWPPEDVLLDFGHIDLFAAENAPELAWAPLLEWIRTHR